MIGYSNRPGMVIIFISSKIIGHIKRENGNFYPTHDMRLSEGITASDLREIADKCEEIAGALKNAQQKGEMRGEAKEFSHYAES